MKYELSELSAMIKSSTTYAKQIELLKKRGLIIRDEDQAVRILSTINYYYITGYLHSFKDEAGNYESNLEFERIMKIIYFDIELRSLCLHLIDIIERCLKTKIAYHFSHEYPFGNVAYLYSESFEEKHRPGHAVLMKYFGQAKQRNADAPFVIHHNQKYEGNMPIWAAIELFTMGNIENFYRILNLKTKKIIAKNYGYGVPKISGWLESIRRFRNMLAHNARLYNLNLKYPPITTNEYPYTSFKIYDYILMLKYLVLDEIEWTNFVNSLKLLISQYSEYICIDDIGFPDDWIKVLESGKVISE